MRILNDNSRELLVLHWQTSKPVVFLLRLIINTFTYTISDQEFVRALLFTSNGGFSGYSGKIGLMHDPTTSRNVTLS
jgi:hypothetical protein